MGDTCGHCVCYVGANENEGDCGLYGRVDKKDIVCQDFRHAPGCRYCEPLEGQGDDHAV